jgi:DNA-binding response OmpR family regulator
MAMSNKDTQAVSEFVRVLLVSPYEEDHLNLRTILRYSNWQHHSVGTKAEATDFVREHVTPVVICESDLPDGTWKDLFAQFARTECPPLLVVTSRFADERLWSEVLNLGAFNVLAKPLNTKEVFHVVGFAAMTWKRHWSRPMQYARTA